jgi:pimeloyl-ACP methyl ester carboxylesterase
MNPLLLVLATLLSAIALYLPTRTQAHTRVDLDGQSIRMLIAGSGDATVVFEAGDGGILEHWGKVQPAVSRFARTVSYDRAGLGLSDIGPAPRDGRRIATELRRALLAAGIAPPYIVAGMSLGGPYVRIFADMFPDDVSGMVLVDPTTTDKERLADGARVPKVPVFLIDAVSPLEVPFATEAIRMQRLKNRPEIEADSIEYKRWLDGIPGGRLIVTNRSGHNVAIEQPELVIATIQQAVDAVKRPRPVSDR